MMIIELTDDEQGFIRAALEIYYQHSMEYCGEFSSIEKDLLKSIYEKFGLVFNTNEPKGEKL